jgi:hypothetical protein
MRNYPNLYRVVRNALGETLAIYRGGKRMLVIPPSRDNNENADMIVRILNRKKGKDASENQQQ